MAKFSDEIFHFLCKEYEISASKLIASNDDEKYWHKCIGIAGVDHLLDRDGLLTKKINCLVEDIPKNKRSLSKIREAIRECFSQHFNMEVKATRILEDASYQAMYCYHLGKIEWHIDKVIAVKSLTEAISNISLCDGIRINQKMSIYGEENNEAQRQGAKNGGKNRAALYTPIKDEVINLLYRMSKVTGKWKNKTVAAKDIEGSVWIFVEKQKKQRKKITLSENALVTTIIRWSRKDLRVKQAFQDTVQKK